ncbi:uncharacterized protein LOC115739158 [Rhodamnia argentea]|uniref:Uncharacterized protein LOC115739158 n=1 Tax=Rhodamnia argentea TaxID=178133 RepID=A0A8B8P278_9MYRT|nr:uncharacterized protein LOC115739158 [Rhodamnia argentea]
MIMTPNLATGSDELLKKTIQHLQKALDDLVSVNSLFTFAMFVGISFASSNVHSLELRSECQADKDTRMNLLVNEVVSFACFLLSSLVATALKMHLSTYLAVGPEIIQKFRNPCLSMLKNLMILVSTLGSILGCIYLTLSMVDVVRVLLGKLSCMRSDTIQAAGSLIAINVLALAIYVPFMMLAIYQSYFNLDKAQK